MVTPAKLCELATLESQRLGHPQVGTEHLLLALIRNNAADGGTTVPQRVFADLEVNCTQAENKTREIISAAGAGVESYDAATIGGTLRELSAPYVTPNLLRAALGWVPAADRPVLLENLQALCGMLTEGPKV